MKKIFTLLTITLFISGALFFNCECSKEDDDDKYDPREKQNLCLTGKVLDNESQDGINGAKVSFYYNDGSAYSPADTVTDSEGNYTIPININENISELRVQATKEGYRHSLAAAGINIEDNFAFVHDIYLNKANTVSHSINPEEGGNIEAYSDESDDYVKISIPANSLPANINSIDIIPLGVNEIPFINRTDPSDNILDNSLPLSSAEFSPQDIELAKAATIEFPLPYEAPPSHEFIPRYYDKNENVWKILKDGNGNPVICDITAVKKMNLTDNQFPASFPTKQFYLFALNISGKIEFGDYEYKDRKVIKRFVPNENENVVVFDYTWTASIDFSTSQFWYSSQWVKNLVSGFTGINFQTEHSTSVNVYRPEEPTDPPEGDKYIWKVNVWWQTIAIPFTITLGDNTSFPIKIIGNIEVGSVYLIENYYEDEGSPN